MQHIHSSFIQKMIELFSKDAYDANAISTRCYEMIPRVHVAKNAKTGRDFIQLGTQRVEKVLVRHGIKISVFSGLDEKGVFKSGIQVETSNTSGKIYKLKININRLLSI